MDYVDEVLFIQTPYRIEKIKLNQIKQISYRKDIENFMNYKSMFYIGSAIAGLALGETYNRQRFPKKDVRWYNRFYGISLGLILVAKYLMLSVHYYHQKVHLFLMKKNMKKQRKHKL